MCIGVYKIGIMKLQRTNIHLPVTHKKWLRDEQERTGQQPAYMVRVALAEFIARRDAKRRKRENK